MYTEGGKEMAIAQVTRQVRHPPARTSRVRVSPCLGHGIVYRGVNTSFFQ